MKLVFWESTMENFRPKSARLDPQKVTRILTLEKAIYWWHTYYMNHIIWSIHYLLSSSDMPYGLIWLIGGLLQWKLSISFSILGKNLRLYQSFPVRKRFGAIYQSALYDKWYYIIDIFVSYRKGIFDIPSLHLIQREISGVNLHLISEITEIFFFI